MTDNKRFEIEDSSIIEGGRVVRDSEQKYTFPSTTHRYLLIGYEKALNELSTENKELKKQLEELNQYCVACDDTIITIQELVDKVLSMNFRDIEIKSDYCHLLNELDYKDLGFLHDCLKAIGKCDIIKMDNLKNELQYMGEE